MNISPNNRKGCRRDQDGLVAPRRSEGGSAALIYIALLAIMMVLLANNVRTIVRLQRELKLVDQKQVQRLVAGQTNTVYGGLPR